MKYFYKKIIVGLVGILLLPGCSTSQTTPVTTVAQPSQTQCCISEKTTKIEPSTASTGMSVSEEPEKKISAEIFFPELIHDFGKVQPKSKLDYGFSFSNAGERPLEIKNIYKSCGCTATTLGKKVLDPNDSSEIKVVWEIGKKPGKQSRTITVMSNDPDHPKIQLTITAEIQASATAEQKTTQNTTIKTAPATLNQNNNSKTKTPPKYILRPRS